MAEQRTLTQPISEAVLVPSLLSAAGGFIDAFAWLAYGHVFTNAQTGNIILKVGNFHWQLAAYLANFINFSVDSL